MQRQNIKCDIMYIHCLTMKEDLKSKSGGGGNAGAGAGASTGGLGNGGIFGSGIFGLFGTTIQCKAEDNSTYCSIMKIFNLLLIVLFVGVIGYAVYSYMRPASSQKGGCCGFKLKDVAKKMLKKMKL